MRNFYMSITRGLVKLLIFAAVIVAGLVFISDNFMARVDQAANRVEDYARGVLSSRGPAITQDLSVQTQETKSEIKDLSKNISQSAWQNFKNWISQKISNIWQSIVK